MKFILFISLILILSIHINSIKVNVENEHNGIIRRLMDGLSDISNSVKNAAYSFF